MITEAHSFPLFPGPLPHAGHWSHTHTHTHTHTLLSLVLGGLQGFLQGRGRQRAGLMGSGHKGQKGSPLLCTTWQGCYSGDKDPGMEHVWM